MPEVRHDEDELNNFGESVPGLEDLYRRHEPPSKGYGAARPFTLAHEHSSASGRDGRNQTDHMLLREAKQMVRQSSIGYCDITEESRSNCETSLKGSWPLPPTAKASWPAAASYCLRQCDACARCRYVSFSPTFGDCSWFAKCDLAALKTRPHGFRTAAKMV